MRAMSHVGRNACNEPKRAHVGRNVCNEPKRAHVGRNVCNEPNNDVSFGRHHRDGVVAAGICAAVAVVALGPQPLAGAATRG